MKRTILKVATFFKSAMILAVGMALFSHTAYAETAANGDEIIMVDLGLPSGTLWADRNVGASAPETYGNYYAWGETTTKSDYSWSTYLDGGISVYTDCGTDKDAMKGITDIAGNATYDAATTNWGAGYKMPTKAQLEELNNSEYTTWTWCDGVDTKYNNTTVVGYKVTSKTNGNSIFLPAAGYRPGTYTIGAGSSGDYWSSSLSESGPDEAWYMKFSSSYRYVRNAYGYRSNGHSVRAVKAGAVTAVEEASKEEAKALRKGVWTINGAYVGEKVENLSAGIYVVDGKKVVVSY